MHCLGRPANAAPKATAAPADVDTATCDEIGGTKRYPAAALAETFRVATVVAASYTEHFDQPQDVVARALATAVLAECDQADDPAYAPVPVLRERADGASPGELLTALLPERREATEAAADAPSVPVDAELAAKVDDACADRAKLAPLIARAEKLDSTRGRRLGLDLAGLQGWIRGITAVGDDPAAEELVDGLADPIGDMGRATGSLAVSRESGDRDRIAAKTAEIRAARSAARKAAKMFDGGKPLPACTKLLGE